MTENSGKGTLIYQGGATCCGSFADWCSRTKWVITTSYIQREKGICCPAIEVGSIRFCDTLLNFLRTFKLFALKISHTNPLAAVIAAE